MSGKIVVGVVPGAIRGNVLDWAVARAIARRRSLDLYSVIRGGVGAAGESAVVDAVEADTRELLETEKELLGARGLEVAVHVTHGDPVRTLIDASEGAALVVIGSDFHEGVGVARGPTGIRICGGAHCPVVVVRDPDQRDRTGVVVGVDGSPVSERAVAFAAAEADRLGEPLVAITTWSPIEITRSVGLYPPEYLRSLEGIADEDSAIALAGLATQYPDLTIERRVVMGYPGAELVRAGRDARLTVVGSHGRGAVARFLLGSVGHEVLMRLPSDLAVVR